MLTSSRLPARSRNRRAFSEVQFAAALLEDLSCTVLVRVTHWITVISFVALLVTGVEILISHPRFYWGEVGNSRTPPLFKIPIPSSRATVPRLSEIRSTPRRAPDAQDESYFPGI